MICMVGFLFIFVFFFLWTQMSGFFGEVDFKKVESLFGVHPQWSCEGFWLSSGSVNLASTLSWNSHLTCEEGFKSERGSCSPSIHVQVYRFTLSKTNIAHENGPFQKENSLPHPFSGAMLVSGQVSFCKIFLLAFVVQVGNNDRSNHPHMICHISYIKITCQLHAYLDVPES